MVLGLSQKERNAALWTALKGGKEEPIRQALARGGDPDMIAPETDACVLAWAAEQYYSSDARERCRLLLEGGANPNLPSGDSGNTPMHYVARRAHRDILALMLEKGGDGLLKNKHGQTPLSQAISQRDWQSMDAMLKSGCLDRLPQPVVGDRDSMQVFALLREVIEQGGHPHYFQPLLDKIPDINVGLSAGYGLAHSAVAKSNVAALDALTARPEFDIDAVLRGGRTLLHIAIGSQNFDMAQSMINKGARVDIADDRGRLPLDVAAQQGAISLMNVIMKKMREASGAEQVDIAVLNRAFLLAAENGHARAAEVLLRAGAEKDAVNDKGETALILATKGQHTEAVKMLIVKHEVDTQQPDNAGLIAYDHAQEHKKKGKPELADYLILFQPGYEPPPPPPPPPPPVDHSRYAKASDVSIDVKEKGLTMTFNFWTQQVIFRDPEIKQGSNMTILKFEDIPRQEAIAEAREMLTRLGGKPPEYNGVGAQKKGGLSMPPKPS
ncbi:MAG TPA: ankyrin repeat domain-containing protein [Alphaproteobacteria bacterium]|nr:ankyrin repeat domain-containing protein [Alphaproteobacteria bacterium]